MELKPLFFAALMWLPITHASAETPPLDGHYYLTGAMEMGAELLLRKDGTSVYITQDLGLANRKYLDYKMDESIYVIGDEQNYHMKVLLLICEGRTRQEGPGHPVR